MELGTWRSPEDDGRQLLFADVDPERNADPEEDLPSNDSGEARLLKSLVAAGTLGGGSLLSGALDAYMVVHLLWLVERCIVIATLLLGIFQFLNSALRVWAGHWNNATLRPLLWRELGLACIVPLTIALAGHWLDPTVALLIGEAVLLATAAFHYVPLEMEIGRVIEAADDLDPSSEFLGKKTLYRLLAGTNHDVATTANEGNDEQPQKAIDWLLRRSRRTKLNRTRILVVRVMTLTVLVALLGPVGVGASSLLTPPPSAKPPQVVHKPPKEPKNSAARASQRPGPTEANSRPEPIRSSQTNWDQLCPTEPGADAPAWAAPEIYALYLGGTDLAAGLPPGGAEAGCTGPTHIARGPKNRFVYVIGADPATGETKSVAVDSTRFGPAIFLAPATAPVLQLIREFGIIGGLPRMTVANGDLYAVRTPKGTVVLVRAQTTASGSPLAEPYTVLPPPVATAWLAAMRSRGTWLWPLPVQAPGAKQSWWLVAGDVNGGRQVATITFDPSSESARLNGHRGPIGLDIAREDLSPYVETAR